MASKKSQNPSSSQYSCWPKSSPNSEELIEVTIPSQRSYNSLNTDKNQLHLTTATTSEYSNSVYSSISPSYYNDTNSHLYDHYGQPLTYSSYHEEALPTASAYGQSFRQSKPSNKKKRWSPDFSQPYNIPSHSSYRNLDIDESHDDSASSSSTRNQNSRERRPRKQPHELLTESQKKANHIASEQKRRQNIRLGFEKLIDIVPSLNHGNRSEALILQKSVDHINYLIAMKNELKSQVRDLQSTLGESKFDEDYLLPWKKRARGGSIAT